MSEPMYLEMPSGEAPQEPPRPGTGESGRPGRCRKWLRWLPLTVVLAALLLVLALWWLSDGGRESRWAVLDANMVPVVTEYSAPLRQVMAQPGMHVDANQVVARLDVSAYARQLARASQELAGLAPGLQEAAQRMQQAQEAELDMVTRLATARNEEAVSLEERDRSVTAHVQAQIALRGIQPYQGKAAYERARQAEAAARTRMEQAREAYEKASRARAALDQELQRIRTEVQLARTRQGQPPVRASQPAQLPTPDENLYAPVSGTVTQVLQSAGQTPQPGNPVLLIAPDDSAAWWVMAYYPADEAEGISAGQAVRITLAQGSTASAAPRSTAGTVWKGKVEEVYPPQMMTLPGTNGGTGDGGSASLVAVRISLDDGAALAQAASAGARLNCDIRTRNLLGFTGL
ncbi:HlyD family efflux transporter periplasmic adaptor subunit [uncultured Desulfovibrio sp.]|uniref:HlyD family secretion protein n=1 Tax=uncultured Desulfovibrio sp. TaxID=167968 RepID=UPI00263292C4|nr:HlyD family efflux transporter periplasmic adaptor subunit [uncultured Desulfovibrio sp.]